VTKDQTEDQTESKDKHFSRLTTIT